MTTAPSGRQTPPVVPDDDTARSSGPGALRGQAWLSLQTHHAQRLIRGHPAAAGKPAIIGLFGFADRLRGIWQGARQDDPYADWWLVKIEDALVAAEQMIKAERATLAQRLEALPALEVAVATSRKAYRTLDHYEVFFSGINEGLLKGFIRITFMGGNKPRSHLHAGSPHL